MSSNSFTKIQIGQAIALLTDMYYIHRVLYPIRYKDTINGLIIPVKV